VDSESHAEVNMSSLTTNDTEAPIVVTAHSTARLSRETYDLPASANLTDVITGTFSMGAIVDLPVHLTCPHGDISYFTFHPFPETIIDEHTTGTHTQNSATWAMDNTAGNLPVKDEHLRLRAPGAPSATEEDTRVTVAIDRVRFNITTIHVDVEIHSVKVSKYGNLSNSIVSLDYITADGIRMVVQNGLNNWSWEKIYNKAINSSKREIEQSLSTALNLTISLNFSWDNTSLQGYDISTMSTEPPIRAALSSGDITPQLYAIGKERFGVNDLKVAQGFLNAGGTAEFTIPAMNLELGVNPVAKLILSPGMRLQGQSGIESLETGERYGYSWDPRSSFHGTIYSTHRKVYTDSKIVVDVLVDLNKVNVNYGNIPQSTIEADITGDLAFYRLKNPSEVRDSLPDGISIEYINADVLRLAYDAGLITRKEIDDIIDNKTKEIEKEMRDSFGDNAFLHIEVDDSTLTGYNVEDMKDTPPIRIKGIAHISMPLSGGEGAGGGQFTGAYVLKEFSIDFPMKPLMGWNITYTVLLPKGIVVTHLQDDHGLAFKGNRDGRDYITVTISDQEDNITATIGITPLFIFYLFELPIILITILGLALYYHHRVKKKERAERKRGQMAKKKQMVREKKMMLEEVREEKAEIPEERPLLPEPKPLTPESEKFDPWKPLEMKPPEEEKGWDGAGEK